MRIQTFFSLFERVADGKNWLESTRTLSQCVLTGRAQEAYLYLPSFDCQKYSTVRSAVLKVYELVPEAYQQRFQKWRQERYTLNLLTM